MSSSDIIIVPLNYTTITLCASVVWGGGIDFSGPQIEDELAMHLPGSMS